jgi:hypothetical protein
MESAPNSRCLGGGRGHYDGCPIACGGGGEAIAVHDGGVVVEGTRGRGAAVSIDDHRGAGWRAFQHVIIEETTTSMSVVVDSHRPSRMSSAAAGMNELGSLTPPEVLLNYGASGAL